MSHFTQVKTECADLDILQRTLETLGFSVEKSTVALYKIRDYYGKDYKVQPDPNPVRCHIRATAKKPGMLAGRSQLGFIKGADGKYTMALDGMDQGKDWCKRFKQTYARESVMKQLRDKGWNLASETTDEKQQIHIRVTRYG